MLKMAEKVRISSLPSDLQLLHPLSIRVLDVVPSLGGDQKPRSRPDGLIGNAGVNISTCTLSFRSLWHVARHRAVVSACVCVVLALALNWFAVVDLVKAAEATKPPVLPMVNAVRIDTSPTETTIRLSASQQMPIDAFVLEMPYRLVIDLPEARFDLAAPNRGGNGLITSWRAGLFATGRSRIVFDLSGPARVIAHAVDPQAGGSATITIRLQPISQADFQAALRERAVPTAPVVTAAPFIKGDREKPQGQESQRKLIIVLDPGHGGIDAGTVSPHTGMEEKQIVLEFAKLLERKLSASGRYEVYLTRSTDTFIPLGERVSIARAHHADLLVSIHADAELDRSVRGSTIFTLSDKASDATAAALANKENQSDARAGIAAENTPDDVADILVDLAKRETRAFSHALAEALVSAMSRSGHMVKQQPHRSASLRVLKAYDLPSVLIELGFLSNKDDESELESPKWRDQTANAILSAIDTFFATNHPDVVP